MPAAGYCSVCKHPESLEINAALIVDGEPIRRVAAQYGPSETSIRRHKEHIPQLLVESSERLKAIEADDLVDRVEGLLAEAHDVLYEARSGGEGQVDNDLALRAMARIEKQLELQAKLLQIIKTQPATQINLYQHPQWIEVRGVILAALDELPASQRERVIEVMRQHKELSEAGVGANGVT